MTDVVELAASLGICIVSGTGESVERKSPSAQSYPPSTLDSQEKEVLGMFLLLKIGKSMPARPNLAGNPKLFSSLGSPLPSGLLDLDPPLLAEPTGLFGPELVAEEV